jgi:hypothetical protein
LSTFPTIKRTGGADTFEQSGAIQPEDWLTYKMLYKYLKNY